MAGHLLGFYEAGHDIDDLMYGLDEYNHVSIAEEEYRIKNTICETEYGIYASHQMPFVRCNAQATKDHHAPVRQIGHWKGEGFSRWLVRLYSNWCDSGD